MKRRIGSVRQRAIRTIPATEARQNFSQLLSEVRSGEDPVVIEKGGVPVAAVVPLAVLERDRAWAAERTERLALLDRMRQPFRSVEPDALDERASEAARAARKERRTKASRR